MSKYGRIQKKKDKRKKRFLILVPIIVLILSLGSYGGILAYKTYKAASDAHMELDRGNKSNLREDIVDPGKDNITVLFLGIDDGGSRNYGERSRTDAIMLATFNQEEKSIKLLSIPRDSYVYQPERGVKDKINHAHAYHGINGIVNTIENMLNIPVDYYVRMNFYAFIEVVDALGGIEVDVPVNIVEMDSQDRAGAIRLTKGLQIINGEEALALARTRKIDNDIERGKRQQLIVHGIIDKATSLTSISRYGNVIDAIGNNLSTNLSLGEIMALHSYATNGSGLNIETIELNGSDMYIGKGYYYEIEDEALETAKQILKKHLELN